MVDSQQRVLFVITIDTEIDKSHDWSVSSRESFQSVVQGIPDVLTPLFTKYRARPTYLLSAEVMENDDCVGVLGDLEGSELGTHLHGDVVEPQRRLRTLKAERIEEMQCSYPRELEFHKLKNLTDLFVSKFGHPPSSFRAGRWGAGDNTIGCLQQLGYKVDSSVSPGVIWDYPQGCADYLMAENQPYFPSLDRLAERGESSVLEVPASVLCSNVKRRLLRSRKVRESREVMRVVERFLPTLWLAPVSLDAVRMNYLMDRILYDQSSQRTVVMNMTFHSIDIIPGASPAAADAGQSRRILRRMEQVLQRASSSGFHFVTLSEVYSHYENGQRGQI
jgi:hypothetical protein